MRPLRPFSANHPLLKIGRSFRWPSNLLFRPIADVRAVGDYSTMAHPFTELDALAHALRESFTAPAIIGIDGWTGIGKTTLGKALAARLSGGSYDLDSALTHDLRRYGTAIRLDEVALALRQPKHFMFVSGICLRQVLADSGCSAAGHIYVKRMATWGWADEDELVAGRALEVRGASGESVRQEVRAYHERWRPHLRADFEFHRSG